MIGLCVRSSYFSLCVCNGGFNIVLGCFIFKQLRRTFHHNIRVLFIFKQLHQAFHHNIGWLLLLIVSSYWSWYLILLMLKFIMRIQLIYEETTKTIRHERWSSRNKRASIKHTKSRI